MFQVLGWPMPARILQPVRRIPQPNQWTADSGRNGLLGALVHFGMPSIDAGEKQDMRALAMRVALTTANGPHSWRTAKATLTP